MRKIKSTAHREQMIVASSSSSDGDVSLGVDQEEAPASPHSATSSSAFP